MKYEKTAKRLMKALSDNDMRAQDLANATGINKASISQYVNGSHAPSNISAGKMADVLGVSPLWLMGFDVQPTAEDEETNIVPLHPDIKEAEEKPSARQVMIATIDKLSDSEKTHWTALMREYLQSKQGNH